MTNNQNEQAMVEKVADALRAAGGLHNPDDATILARAAIAALREPTEAMTLAGCRCSRPALFKASLHPQPGDGPATRRELAATVADANRRWQAMIDEALK